MKFGGSSLESIQPVQRVADIVKAQLSAHPLVVVSAMGETTDVKWGSTLGCGGLSGRLDSGGTGVPVRSAVPFHDAGLGCPQQAEGLPHFEM